MSELSQLDRTFSFILKRMVETGQAPFYTEIAAELGVSVEEGRKALHALLGPGIAAWVFPNTDYIAPFPLSAIFPPSTGSRSKGNRSGLVSEGLSRWRSAGSSKGKQCGSMLRVLIADYPSGWR